MAGETQQQAQPGSAGSASEQGQTFAERTAARLAAERQAPRQEQPEPRRREQQEFEQDDPDMGLSPDLESAVDEELAPVGEDTDELEVEDPEALADDEGENPDGDAEAEAAVDWEKRFKDTQRQLTRLNEERRERDAEQAQLVEQAVSLRHELEDQLDSARRYAAVYVDGMNAQIANLERAFQTGQIEPDKMADARQQHQTLIQQREFIRQQVEQLDNMQKEALQKERERKAEMARVRLARTIPNWGRETYQQLGQYAQERGYSAAEFAETTDPRLIELLHDSMMLRKAGKKVTSVRQRRQQNAPTRTAREQPRSADGKFRKAQQQFRQNPGDRKAFRAMKEAQLAKERR